ncbi:MAG: MFS transporter [Spirochaetota bacterium]|nr:MFS transporter [Spirochaetota bacterium]
MHQIDYNAAKRIVLLIVSIASFITPFMGSSINIALPSIGNEFSMNTVLLSWVATSYMLAAAMFLVPFGKMADIYGRKKFFTYGISIYTISSLLSAISKSALMLICFRIMQGVGSAMIFATGTALITLVFPERERGKALGINVASVYIGLSLGPLGGGLLTQHFGWRIIFLINIPFGLIIIIVILWKLRGEWEQPRGEKFDLIGSIIYSFSLVAIMYGFSLLPGRAGIWLIVIGALGICSFIWWGINVEDPLLNMDLFRDNKVFALSNLAAFINYTATFSVGFILSLYLQYVKVLSPQSTGLILVSRPIVMAILSPFAGRISDRIESRILISTGSAFITIGLLLLSFLDEKSSVEYIIVSLILLGFGFALFSSPNINAIMSSVDKNFYGIASSTIGTMRLTGQMFSMGIAMLIFSIYMGEVQITPESYAHFCDSIGVAFFIFANLCFWGIFASFARR